MPRQINYPFGNEYSIETSEDFNGEYFIFGFENGGLGITKKVYLERLYALSDNEIICLLETITNLNPNIAYVLLKETIRRYENNSNFNVDFLSYNNVMNLIPQVGNYMLSNNNNQHIRKNNLDTIFITMFNYVDNSKLPPPSYFKICTYKKESLENFDCEVCVGCKLTPNKDINKCMQENVVRGKKLKMTMRDYESLSSCYHAGAFNEAKSIINQFLKNLKVEKDITTASNFIFNR